MRIKIAVSGTLFTILFLVSSCTSSDPFPELKGPYLGQESPGDIPEIFAEGILTFGSHEHHLSVAPDLNEIFYVVADRYRIQHIIIQVVEKDGQWQTPVVASFSGAYSDFAPTYYPDGSALLFCSNRPMPGDTVATGDFNIWKVEKIPSGWGNPSPLSLVINDGSNEYNPTITADGTLYFQDHDETGTDIYRSTLTNGTYAPPEKLGQAINSPFMEIGPWVSADETMLFFTSNRDGGYGSGDFYVSFGSGDGRWQPAVNMGESINSSSFDGIITMSPDEQYFFFTNFTGLDIEKLKGNSYSEIKRLLQSPKNGDGTIYWISSEFADTLRK